MQDAVPIRLGQEFKAYSVAVMRDIRRMDKAMEEMCTCLLYTSSKRAAKDKRAVAAGHICIDITPLFPKGSTGEAGRIRAPGQLVQMEGCLLYTSRCV